MQALDRCDTMLGNENYLFKCYNNIGDEYALLKKI